MRGGGGVVSSSYAGRGGGWIVGKGGKYGGGGEGVGVWLPWLVGVDGKGMG